MNSTAEDWRVYVHLHVPALRLPKGRKATFVVKQSNVLRIAFIEKENGGRWNVKEDRVFLNLDSRIHPFIVCGKTE